MNNINELSGNPERASRIKMQREFLSKIQDHYNEDTWTDMAIEMRALCFGHYLQNTEQEEGNSLIDNRLVKYIMIHNENTRTMKNKLKIWISLVFSHANAEIDKIQGNIMIQK